MKKPTAETLTIKGQSMKLYRQRQTKGGTDYEIHTLAYTANGARHRKSFASEEKARASAKTIAEQLAEGTGHAHALTPGEVADYVAARAAAAPLGPAPLASIVAEAADAKKMIGGASLVAAAACYLREMGRQKLPDIKVPDLIQEFYIAKEKSGRSPAYIGQLKKLLPKFEAVFRCPVASVTTGEIQKFLDGLRMSNRSRENYRCAIASLFSFARKRGYLPRDVSTEAEHIEGIKSPERPAGIYTPEQLRAALDASDGLARLAVAIGAFAGLRTSEIFRLCWRDIGKTHITVEAEKAKTGARRIVPILPGLRAVLASVERGEAAAKIFSQRYETHLSRVLSDAFRAAKIEPVRNGLRHSFCSYRLATTKDTPATALEAGNSPTIIFRHYRELATSKAAAAWFAVRPPKAPSNILTLRKAS